MQGQASKSQEGWSRGVASWLHPPGHPELKVTQVGGAPTTLRGQIQSQHHPSAEGRGFCVVWQAGTSGKNCLWLLWSLLRIRLHSHWIKHCTAGHLGKTSQSEDRGWKSCRSIGPHSQVLSSRLGQRASPQTILRPDTETSPGLQKLWHAHKTQTAVALVSRIRLLCCWPSPALCSGAQAFSSPSSWVKAGTEETSHGPPGKLFWHPRAHMFLQTHRQAQTRPSPAQGPAVPSLHIPGTALVTPTSWAGGGA